MHRGFVSPLLFVLVAVSLIGGGIYLHLSSPAKSAATTTPSRQAPIHTERATGVTSASDISTKSGSATSSSPAAKSPTGALLEYRLDTHDFRWPSESVIIDSDYYLSKNATAVFFGNKIIPNADPHTFSIIQKIEGDGRYVDHMYVKDRHSVYEVLRPDSGSVTVSLVMYKLPNADPETFAIIDTKHAKDKTRVFWFDVEVSADAVHFRELPIHDFYADSSAVIYGGTRFPLDPVTFSSLQGTSTVGYVSDRNGLYYFAQYANPVTVQKLQNVDAASFEVLGENGYAKDKNNIFFRGTTLDGADMKTFELLEYGYARDKNNVYSNWGQIVPGADPKTYKPKPIAWPNF